MKRQRLTQTERDAIWKAQGGACSCGCGQSLTSGPVDEEHTVACALPAGAAKPDALMLRECHKFKTKRDRAAMAKLDRLTGETKSQWHGTKQRKTLRHPYWRKKLNGEVVPR